MILLNNVTKNELQDLFVSTCEKLSLADSKCKDYYLGLIRESIENKTFNLLGNFCYLLKTYDDLLEFETFEFLTIIGSA